MKTEILLEVHNQCIDILQAIQFYENAIYSARESLNGYPGELIETRKMLQHDIDISQRCIERLKQRYIIALNRS